MALVVKDRVKENTTTTGTGSVTLAGAVYGFQTFSSTLSNSDTTYYAIVDGISGDFEVGLGTYSAGVLSRDTILESSNAGAAVSLASGTKEVFITYPAEKSVYLDASDNVNLPGNLELSGTVDGRDVAADGAQIDSLGSAAFADTTDFAAASHTHSLATVATSGAYSDLSGTPTIGSGIVSVQALNGLSGGGTFGVNQTSDGIINLAVDLNELTTLTSIADNDYFPFVDLTDGSSKKIALQNIGLSKFDNDAGYITGYTETDTLDSVTDRGATTSNSIEVGSITTTGGATVGTNLTVTGDLTVNGTTTTVNSNTVNIGDNIIVLNADETGTPSQNGGIEVERGTSTNVSFVWNETSDYWDFGGEEIANLVLDGGTY